MFEDDPLWEHMRTQQVQERQFEVGTGDSYACLSFGMEFLVLALKKFIWPNPHWWAPGCTPEQPHQFQM